MATISSRYAPIDRGKFKVHIFFITLGILLWSQYNVVAVISRSEFLRYNYHAINTNNFGTLKM